MATRRCWGPGDLELRGRGPGMSLAGRAIPAEGEHVSPGPAQSNWVFGGGTAGLHLYPQTAAKPLEGFRQESESSGVLTASLRPPGGQVQEGA